MKEADRRRWTFAELYPNVARWVQGHGWIELGEDLPGPSFVLALDEGGSIWEGEAAYPTADDALRALDAALGRVRSLTLAGPATGHGQHAARGQQRPAEHPAATHWG